MIKKSFLEKFTGSEKNFDFLANLCEKITKKLFDFQFTPIQKKKVREIIKRTLLQERHSIIFSECRQVGKTETVCFTEFFLSYIFPLLKGERYRGCFVSPEKGTSLEIFDRLKLLYDQAEQKFPGSFPCQVKSKDEIVLQNGSKFEIFGLFKGYARKEDKKSTKEGRTYHKVVRDEMHLGEDDIFSDEIEPAMSTTGGVDIWIGNGGFKQCDAKKKIETGTNETQTVFLYTYKIMREEYLRLFKETCNPMFSRWVKSQDKYIEDKGEDSDFVKKNLFCEWIVERGNFIRPEKLYLCRRGIGERRKYETNVCDVGIDWGKKHDSTIVTVIDYDRNIRYWHEINNGSSYVDQVEEISDFLHDLAENFDIEFQRCFCDSTASQDTQVDLLEEAVGDIMIVEGVPFTVQSKDQMAKKMERCFTSKEEKERLSYPNPKSSKLSREFEKQMIALEKEFRSTGKVTFHHPKSGDIHDDFADSFALSVWGIEELTPKEVAYFV